MGGTEHRMESFAKYLVKELNYKLPKGVCLENISLSSHRFAMYKVGSVISVSHGMGAPSLSILLNELIKLLHYAEAKDPIFIRIGTSGGLGHDPGTLIVTRRPVNPDLSYEYKTLILGKEREFPAVLDEKVAKELCDLGEQIGFKITSGDTVCCNDFYEGQGRLDGPFCDYGESDKMSYLGWLKKHGVSNIEMESVAFGAITHRAGIRSGIVCVAFVNRLNGDQLTNNKEDLEAWQLRPQKL
ncbi:udp [Lepeophtheirus salmonis]|uniref:Uridine phosphorylase n=1 Tax=Lepeophtheirus salmonis TaxID=72036 RepID=A0A7R8GZB8_LEPSM|nr:udp [Lepeophtheirus salmonis]CAF2761056.1 udp [Lepeophtheirus salmonis]